MAMFRLVYGGVMERFPNLKIGHPPLRQASIPYLAGRMEWNDDFNEMRMGHKDILFPHKPLEYFRRMYYDTANNGYPAGLRCGMDFAGIASSSSPQISPSATRKACASSATPSPPWTPSIWLRGIAARFSRATPWISSGCR